MTPEQVTQVIQDNITRFWPNNLLTPAQQTLVEEILWKVNFSPDLDNSLDFPHWYSQVTALEQELMQRLTSLPSPPETTGENPATLRFALLWLYHVAAERAKVKFNNLPAHLEFYQSSLSLSQHWQDDTDPRVREGVLTLHVNLGLTLGQAGRVEEAIKQYQSGLSVAQHWLTGKRGENDPGVRELILWLYEKIPTTWYQLHHLTHATTLLPMVGLWTWSQAGKPQNAKLWQELFDNWPIFLEISPDYPTVTRAFQTCFQTLLDWHDPNRPHRHFGFVSTATLLAISESLYGLEQAEEHQHLSQVYQQLQQLEHSPIVAEAHTFPQEQQDRYTKLTELWQQLSLSPPSATTKLNTLECNKNYCTTLECNKNYCTTLECNKNYCTDLQRLPWWKKLWYHSTITQLRDQMNAYQERQRRFDAARQHWQTAVTKADTAILDWLVHNLHQQHPTLPGEGLEESSSILLGILLASSAMPVADTLKQWQVAPPWQTPEQMQIALTSTQWGRFILLQEPQLFMWMNGLRDAHFESTTMQRLNISLEKENFAQPELQKWLQEFSQGRLDSLQRNLESAWKEAQEQANNLADSLPWLELTEVLAMVILGDTQRQSRLSLQQYLTDGLDTTAPILDTLAALKQRFNRAVSIYEPVHLPLEQTVSEWARVQLEEILQDGPRRGEEKIEVMIWETLERARIGLTSLTFQPPENWQEELGKQLWEALRDSINWIRQGNLPADDSPWPPLVVWLEAFDKWLQKSCNNSYCTPEYVTVLSDAEALVQPFFDPLKQWLRLLWLDNTQGLLLRDLPAECRDQACWYNADKTGLCDEWEESWEESDEPDIDKLMTSPPVTSLANTLRHWADSSQCTQLTVIFPAPLGQLPWEMLEPVENLLVRTVRLTKWYASHTPRASSTAPATPWVLGTSNLNPNDLRCSNTEARWVATQWGTTPELPDRPILLFDALQKLATAKRLLISTHGKFDRNNPLESGLLLSGLKDDKATSLDILPLWLCSTLRVPGEILILSACQSNLSGQQTAGLLSPIGIGPALSAAGAQIVIGCLWEVNEVATLTFIYHLLTLAKTHPDKPWHQLATLAREKVRKMTREEMKKMRDELMTKEEPCRHVLAWPISGQNELPLSHPYYWAGFNVII